MTLYRIRFKILSAVVTPLKGDTIWGHIVWGIANHEGDEAVAKFLEQEKSCTPELVVSSAFPAGMICRALRPPEERKESFGTEEYSEIKEKKKIKYESASDYFHDTEAPVNAVTENPFKSITVMHNTIDRSTNTAIKEKKNIKYESASDYFLDTQAPVNAVTENPFKSITVMHNTIDRSTNTVMEGGLYSSEEKWIGKDTEWDLYILSSYSPERVKELVGWAFENGYGADASTGKGRIDEIKSGPIQVKPKNSGKHYMALGPFTDPKNELKDIRADIFVRSGKVGGAFAASLSPYKKPVVLYDEGAVFDCDNEIEYAGVLLDKMHGKDGRICQSGFAPVIPIGA